MSHQTRAWMVVAGWLLGLTLAGGLAAQTPSAPPCVVEDTDPGIGGRFAAVVSGADPLATELAGFATSSGAEGRGWSLHLVTPGGANSILLFAEGTGRPAPGTYRVVDYVATDATPPRGQYVGTVALENDILGASGFFSVKGSLTVVESSVGSVAGCFEFSAQDMLRTQSTSAHGTFASTDKDPG